MDWSTRCRTNILNIKPYVPGKPIEEVERELGLSDVIKLASNENPLGPSPKGVEALREAAGRVQLYPDGYCYDLRQELAQKYALPAENILIGNGSDELLKLLAETFINPGDEAVTGTPSFSEYEFAVRLMDGRLVEVPLKDFRFDLEAMAEAITGRTKIIFVCNPNNPTGTVVGREEVNRFLNRVPEDVLVVFDEAYHEYVTDPAYPDSLGLLKAGRSNVVVLRTFSKIYGLAGLRVGYGFAAASVAKLAERTREPFNVNLLGQAAAAAALKDAGHLSESTAVNEAGKKQLAAGFEKLGLPYIPTQANFMMADCGIDSRELFQGLLRRGVIVRTGDIFGMDTWIRVTVGTEKQNQKFLSGLAGVLGQ